MINDVFTKADILLPDGVSMEDWSVIACDQFSSEREYWDNARIRIGESPSTLNMIIPEAYLGEIDEINEINKISAAMESYTRRGLFRRIEDSFVYVVRTLPDGRDRRGLVGAVDLEEYEFSGIKGSVLASEETVRERLPARVRIRQAACIELPHIMAFINDIDMSVIEPLSKKADGFETLYDFNLMEGGGHIKGARVHGSAADDIIMAMRGLHRKNDILMVIGDGNHSLAAAKVYWDGIKKNLSADERESHPARKALLEVNNVYDPSIDFEAIHRVVFDVDVNDFVGVLTESMPSGDDYILRWTARGNSGAIGVAAGCIGDMLTDLQTFLDEYIDRNGCGIDYIHGEEAAVRLAEREKSLGLILPPMDKSELFKTVADRGVFPRKSFSVGHARDKRYYLECRRIND